MWTNRQSIGSYRNHNITLIESSFYHGQWFLGGSGRGISEQGEVGPSFPKWSKYFSSPEEAVDWFCQLPGAVPLDSIKPDDPKVCRSVPLF
jgi:hypothetical protein